eukprot:gene7499-10217_t
MDKIRINQVVRNLATNAIKFSKPGDSVAISFEIDDYNDDNREVTAILRCNVIDSGAGVSLENQKELFSQFAQFDRNMLQGGGGTGLGLWISRIIVNMHGGEMQCVSEGKGKGSNFCFTIPLQLSNNKDETQLNGSEKLLMMASLSNDCTIDEPYKLSMDIDLNTEIESKPNNHFLLVDDYSLNRKVLGRLLNSVDPNCSLDEADDGSTAIELVRNNKLNYDIIFLDFVMKSVHGPETAHTLRQLGDAGPIIGVTGNALPEDIDSFKSAGVNNVMTKPVRKEQLHKLIKKIIL